MKKISILDCTLRDGGYCNQWKFGFNNAKKIVNGLIDAGIEIIECGFLSDRVQGDLDNTRFTDVNAISRLIPLNRANNKFVAMINYGEYPIDALPEFDGTSIDGIRVAFHKKDCAQALSYCKEIQKKGYQVFVQPMVSLSYSEEEFADLIERVNQLEPYAFYIVDSFGSMKKKQLMRLFSVVESKLFSGICVGFHSHNNMQLAYSNAQSLVEINTVHSLIIDTSVYGMGRGAGNLNTELFVDYLNDSFDSGYRLKPLLTIIDEILNHFYKENYWGYSLPNYLSAAHNVHPNYATHFAEKNTLTAEAMENIFSAMDDVSKVSFDRAYAEQMYLRFMSQNDGTAAKNAEMKGKFEGRTVLLIAPGKSATDEREKILTVCGDDVITVGVNYDFPYYDTDFIFLSNMRRLKTIDKVKYARVIATSNVSTNDLFLKVDYNDLLCPIEPVRDNAGMMAVQFLIDMGVKKILLAGFDGYSYQSEENYAAKQMMLHTEKTMTDAMNRGMTEMLIRYSKEVAIEFVTGPHYVHL